MMKISECFGESNNVLKSALVSVGQALSQWNDDDEGDKMRLELLTMTGRPWQYRGEGNANIVIALEDEMRVIRLSKVNLGESLGHLSRQRRKVEREVMFANRVFGPLLGFEFVRTVSAVQISSMQILQLNETLKTVRPSYRLHKELKVPYATCHSDFARIAPLSSEAVNYCVEIKPKQGWWPKNTLLGKSSPELCTYCLNQYLKLKRSKISSRTTYCPLNLFSGQAHRMITAIIGLIANPQNNLRIFRNGCLVYGDSKCDALEPILEEWFRYSASTDSNLSKASTSSSKLSNASNFIGLMCCALLKPFEVKKEGAEDQEQLFEDMRQEIEQMLKCTEYMRMRYLNDKSDENVHLQPLPSSTVHNFLFERTPVDSTRCSKLCGRLPEGSILARILRVQKLGQRGVRSIYRLFQRICPYHRQPRKLSHHVTHRSTICRTPTIESISSSCPRQDFGLLHNPSDDDDDDDSTEETEDDEDVLLNEDDLTESDMCEDDDLVTTEPLFPTVIPQNGLVASSEVPSECPSRECMSIEEWLDEIVDLTHLRNSEIDIIERYLIAATAKDCSIMVTFCPSLPSRVKTTRDNTTEQDYHVTLPDMRGMNHTMRIGVADLDPKPLTCIVNHCIRDKEMFQAYAAMSRSCRR